MTPQQKTGMYIVMAAICLFLWAPHSRAQVVVIAHTSVPVDTLGKSELLDFYTFDIRKWSDGKPVVVFDLKPKTGAKEAFYAYLGKPSSRMKSIWLKKMLSGEADPPESMNSEEELLDKVASTVGAIGFVSKSNASEDVKILIEIDDKKK